MIDPFWHCRLQQFFITWWQLGIQKNFQFGLMGDPSHMTGSADFVLIYDVK